MRRYVLLNEDGTVNNIVAVEDASVVENHADWSLLTSFDYTDWALEDHPRTHWVYDFETEEWGNKELPLVAPNVEFLVPVEEPAEDVLAGGN
jgi:hypothetical protein